VYCRNPMNVTHTSQAGMAKVASHPHHAIAGRLPCDGSRSAIACPRSSDMTLRR
jgi:hypothetical protein